MALNGWHIGERAIRQKVNFSGDLSLDGMYTWISEELDPGLAQFHGECHFLPITTMDSQGRPWGSILAPKGGRPGSNFIQYIGESRLRVNAQVWDGEPILRTGKDNMLVAGIGIHFPTRRRNKIAGSVSRYERARDDGHVVSLDMVVNETIGNCPKYINLRHLSPHSNTQPRVATEKLHLMDDESLPDELVNFILASDTVFLGTTYVAPHKEAALFPSHLGMNQRGGLRGFIRVSRKDGRTLALPDFSGNRILTSLGNIEATHLASFTFVDFKTGAILYLTGEAKNLVGEDAKRIMPMHNKMPLTTLFVTGYTFVLDALPVRQTVGTDTAPSPYSPPLRFLAEEDSGHFTSTKPDQTVLLTRIDLHSSSIATFWFQSSTPLTIRPGQAAILSFVSLLGQSKYAHMAPSNPKSLNDDRVRTWTVSASSTHEFALTMRQIPSGVVTGALFNLGHALARSRPEFLSDTSGLQIQLGLIGFSGSFCLPSPIKGSEVKLLWFAGGIGFTPFLSMLRALKEDDSGCRWDIYMALSTRDPDVLLPLLTEAVDIIPRAKVKFVLDLYTTAKVMVLKESTDVRIHSTRVDLKYIQNIDLTRKIYLCGPKPFEQTVLEGLAKCGVGADKVTTEGFAY
ncbi:hypothetical protein J3R30DRAFT_3480173 [Lentinula aciculospora]|uniref:Oxidoreductase FAD/NAD(P)-binding domain-containing protein n=1 Tax=Lentinula aciculospora TaxID=153920 RepID=A0A9W9ABB0_9AGAR|nr:hypothetical protein J3R30DRAFT_3480173 [Lentinula aciculospora]